MDRRDMLRWLGVGASATALGCKDDTSGGDDTTTPDAAAAVPDAEPGTPGCTITQGDAQGPFFEAGAPTRTTLAEAGEPGTRMEIAVEVLAEGCEEAAEGVLVDVWQADAAGAYHDAARDYRLRGQTVTPADGRFTIATIHPGNYMDGAGWRPAHLHFTFSHPDYVTVTTQLYFAGDPYLPPNDSCAPCTSEDPDRQVALTAGGDGVERGTWRVVLRRV
jgi:protocatechuate 3,4-dioxygenase beta subunit